ncbi:MAG: hypothetical protein V1757_05550 [Actinomycetota bacterium]
MIGVKRTLLSVLVSVLLVATAVASVWLMASAGVFTGGETTLPGAPGGETTTTAGPGGPIDLSGDYQVAQPRDPFQPLVVPPAALRPPRQPKRGRPPPRPEARARRPRRRPRPGAPRPPPRATSPPGSG